ncbi:Bcr/CflA family multidrug efflux MFS transporter [Echinicola jeungdonensis]|uniref:Bcr/CflA family multidrug efflux MFS transporter n=1 Tax=Echinicola jeungdonensis TaxID=709343 RepID=A0ABV5J904_9BACT|nr:Bcr/CflA family multidrug efflux MFS transporter [Echinicola jeungdonensis]MDN3670757.1 Bcr/CflA family multidrug efflux MFS transporter [Echinicola jeungdonensis]
MSKKQYFIIILILGALSTISPFSIDMYLPGFPAIAKNLNTSIANVQLSLTSYLVGIAIGQLFYGPLLDRFGRKKPLYIGLFIYVLASVGCVFTQNVDNLILMRFIQAIGGCAGMVAAQALVRDIFPVTKTAQALAMLMLVIAVSPMIAPTLGGHITAHFHWHMVFLTLAAITLVILIASYFVLPEGAKPDPAVSLRPHKVLKNYLEVSKNPQFLTYMLVGGIAGATPFAYIAGSADVFMNIYGVTEQQYGWIFASLATAMIGSTQLNHLLLKRFTSQQIIRVSLTYQTLVGFILILGVWNNWFNVITLIALMFVFLSGHGLCNPNAAALTLAPFSRNAGSAAAMMGSMRMAMGGVVSAAVSVFHNGTASPMVIMMTFCSVGGLLTIIIDKSVKKRNLVKNGQPKEPSMAV